MSKAKSFSLSPLIISAIVAGLGLYYKSTLDNPEPKEEEKIVVERAEPEATEAIDDGPPTVEIRKPIARKSPTPRTLSLPESGPPPAEGFAPFDSDGSLIIRQIVIQGDNLTFHGDLLVGKLKDLDKIKTQKKLTIKKPELWPDGRVPFVLDESLTHPDRVLEAMEVFHQNSSLQFVERDGQENYLVFEAGEKNCYSYVGQIGGSQPVYLSSACDVRSIVHELMHSAGFFHEQNREDRDEFVTVFWDNIPKVHHTQFKKFPNSFMRTESRPFDYNSIMLYPSQAFSEIPGEPSITHVNGEFLKPTGFLSSEDIQRLNILYPGTN